MEVAWYTREDLDLFEDLDFQINLIRNWATDRNGASLKRQIKTNSRWDFKRRNARPCSVSGAW